MVRKTKTTKEKVLNVMKDIRKGMGGAHSTKEAIGIGLANAGKAAKKALSDKAPRRKVGRPRTRHHAHA